MSGAQIGYVPTGIEATFETCLAEFDDLDHMNELGRVGWEPVSSHKGMVLMRRKTLVFGNAVPFSSLRPRN